MTRVLELQGLLGIVSGDEPRPSAMYEGGGIFYRPPAKRTATPVKLSSGQDGAGGLDDEKVVDKGRPSNSRTDHDEESQNLQAKWDEKNLAASLFLLQMEADALSFEMMTMKTAAQMWSSLEARFMRGTLNQLQTIGKRINEFRYEGNDIMTYCRQLKALYNESASLGQTYPIKDMV